MKEADLPADFVSKCKAITAKRAKTVIDHILKHGSISTEDLKTTYGYDHPPRAIRDVKDNGIPIQMFKVKAENGRSIAAYKFGDPKQVRSGRFAGRTILGTKLREELVRRDGARCAIYREMLLVTQLQIDHRVPFEVAGDDTAGDPDAANFMLLSAPANRAKAWACEHCKNRLELKDPDICANCYWAYPDDYKHIAMEEIRRVDILWKGDETKQYDALSESAKKAKQEVPDYVKAVLKRLPISN